MPKPGLRAILRTLIEREVDFIVVGGVAMVLVGATYNTGIDLDLVHSANPETATRLLAALEEMDAYYRLQPERRLRPNASHLTSLGHQLLLTKFGPLDLHGCI